MKNTVKIKLLLTLHLKCVKMQLKVSCKNRGDADSMSKFEKAIERFKSVPSDYTYDELKNLLSKMDFEEFNQGKTSGSRVRFYRKKDDVSISIHKPHPGNIMKRYAIKLIIEELERIGEIK